MRKPSDTFERCHESVVDGVRAGASIADAARKAGCSPRTVDRWLQAGRLDRHGS
jgi:transposase-like protein